MNLTRSPHYQRLLKHSVCKCFSLAMGELLSYPPQQSSSEAPGAPGGHGVLIGEQKRQPRHAWASGESELEAATRDTLLQVAEVFSPVPSIPLAAAEQAVDGGEKPPDYALHAAYAMLCCCPIGAVALWHSKKVYTS